MEQRGGECATGQAREDSTEHEGLLARDQEVVPVNVGSAKPPGQCEKTAPLADYYRSTGELKSVDGMADMKAVTAEIERVLETA